MMRAAVFNPKNLPVEQLPKIYGFNNGPCGYGDFAGILVADDGAMLGEHVCSSESWMRHDLGIDEGARPDRHKTFQAHYPDGYRMEFVPYSSVPHHEGLKAAVEKWRPAPAEGEAQ